MMLCPTLVIWNTPKKMRRWMDEDVLCMLRGLYIEVYMLGIQDIALPYGYACRKEKCY